MKRTRDITLVALFAALMAVCSWISIPAVVPFTLQTFAVFVAVGLLGGGRGSAATAVYLLLGAVGVPVFAGFSGGLGRLLGATGGYLLGLLACALCMWGAEKLAGRGFKTLAGSMLLGLALCYALGSLWFSLVYARTTGPIAMATVLSWCVFPFVLPDLAKMALALVLVKRIKKHLPT